MKEVKELNKQLLKAQKDWYDEIMLPLFNDNCNRIINKKNKKIEASISCPFCMGLTEDYVTSNKKKVMIVGQVARHLGLWNRQWQGKNSEELFSDKDAEADHWPAKRMQNWANDCLNVQLGFKDPSVDVEKKSSALWAFFRDIKNDDVALCWNDLDKLNYIYDYEDSKNYKETTLTYQDEVFLSGKYKSDEEDNNYSLLQREIIIAQPDIIIFAVGPYYAVSLDVALGISNRNYENKSDKELSKKSSEISKLFENYPNVNTCIVENCCLNEKVNALLGRKDVAVLWTYHPTALRKLKLYDNAVPEINDKILK